MKLIDEVESWKEDVMIHCQTVATVMNDRRILKENMKNYLRKFFNYDLIEFDSDFNVITLFWHYDNEPVIDPTELNDLGMEFVISTEYKDQMGMTAIMKLYPFGVPEEE